MSRGTEFITLITGKIQTKIAEIGEKIQEVQKDIEGMHEYYWENYTEMDQYGYENFDNQQALLTQVNANEENLNIRRRLRRMLDSPFFGSVDFVYEGDDAPETFYIGIGNFSEKTGALPLIYDWRAPVSSLFYDYDKGEASYEAPLGILHGEILSKRQYKIRSGKMLYEFESDIKIDDDILRQELGANSDTQLKNIVRTIQKEQNAIIRNTTDKILVIQGAAGSGKTSVALHRIAYLLYHDRGHLRSSNILVLSPNSVFSDYISHILPELGEENIREMSFDLFAYRELKDIVQDCKDRYHHIEASITHPDAEADRRFRWKQSDRYTKALEGFLVELEDRLVDFREITFKKMSMPPERMLEMFYFKFPDIPLLSRMDALADYFIDAYETLTDSDLPEEDKNFIHQEFQKQYVTTDIYEIYNWLMEQNDLPALPDLPPEKRILEYEDVYPMLYLKYRLKKGKTRREVRHLVIDEMQDYSYLQFIILDKLFSCNMTILGDRTQTVDTHPQDVLSFLPRIFGRKIRMIEMKKSYRNTAEIAAYAAGWSSETDIEYLQRHGKEVEKFSCSSPEEMLDIILAKVSVGTERYETAAVLTMTEAEAQKVYGQLKEQRTDISCIDRNSSKFMKGITVTTYYLAKGLEFDQVFLAGGDPENPFYKSYQYISATRALHELYILQ